MVATMTASALLGGYVAQVRWPHLAASYPTLATALVTLFGAFAAGNVVAKKFEPPKGDP